MIFQQFIQLFIDDQKAQYRWRGEEAESVEKELGRQLEERKGRRAGRQRWRCIAGFAEDAVDPLQEGDGRHGRRHGYRGEVRAMVGFRTRTARYVTEALVGFGQQQGKQAWH